MTTRDGSRSTARPARPAHEPVDRVARLGLGQRELVVLAVERVPPAGDPIRPRREHLPAGRPCTARRSRSRRAPHDRRSRTPQPAADLDDRRPLGSEAQVVLLARRRDHAVRTARPSTISRRIDVSASIASDACAPGLPLRRRGGARRRRRARRRSRRRRGCRRRSGRAARARRRTRAMAPAPPPGSPRPRARGRPTPRRGSRSSACAVSPRRARCR